MVRRSSRIGSLSPIMPAWQLSGLSLSCEAGCASETPRRILTVPLCGPTEIVFHATSRCGAERTGKTRRLVAHLAQLFDRGLSKLESACIEGKGGCHGPLLKGGGKQCARVLYGIPVAENQSQPPLMTVRAERNTYPVLPRALKTVELCVMMNVHCSTHSSLSSFHSSKNELLFRPVYAPTKLQFYRGRWCRCGVIHVPRATESVC